MLSRILIASGILSLVVLFFITSSFYQDSPQLPDEQPPTATTSKLTHGLPQKVQGITLDAKYDFAGESVPMDRPDARERLERELLVNSYLHSSTLLLLKRSKRAIEIIDPILKAEGIPTDFAYLAAAESAYMDATSPAGAKGVWQFMKTTGNAYGLEINDDIDERYHLEKATLAACQMLKNYHERFGSWLLAAAAYNMGETAMAREKERQQADNYFELNVSDETMRYVFRILALKSIIEAPQKFGFYLQDSDYYPAETNLRTLEVSASVPSWGAFAKANQSDYRELKRHNPWLRSWNLDNSKGKTYQVSLPQ